MERNRRKHSRTEVNCQIVTTLSPKIEKNRLEGNSDRLSFRKLSEFVYDIQCFIPYSKDRIRLRELKFLLQVSPFLNIDLTRDFLNPEVHRDCGYT